MIVFDVVIEDHSKGTLHVHFLLPLPLLGASYYQQCCHRCCCGPPQWMSCPFFCLRLRSGPTCLNSGLFYLCSLWLLATSGYLSYCMYCNGALSIVRTSWAVNQKKKFTFLFLWILVAVHFCGCAFQWLCTVQCADACGAC